MAVLTLQEDDRCMNPRDRTKVNKTFSCLEHFAILQIGLAYVDTFGAAVGWLDNVLMLFVRHVGKERAMLRVPDEVMMMADQLERSV